MGGGSGSTKNLRMLNYREFGHPGSTVLYIDPWDMLNNFCFHVDAQKSLFIGGNGNGFFDIIIYTRAAESS